MSAQIIRLLVVDDHPIVRAGFRTIEEMASDIQIVGEASDAQEAFRGVANLQPDVVLLDIRLQGHSGIEVCRHIKAASPSPRVLILTSYADEQMILSALEAGTDGYLLKESDTRRLVDAIREVAKGETVFDSRVTRQLASRGSGERGGGAELLGQLSAQECRLLAEVAQGKTDKEVAAALGLTTKRRATTWTASLPSSMCATAPKQRCSMRGHESGSTPLVSEAN